MGEGLRFWNSVDKLVAEITCNLLPVFSIALAPVVALGQTKPCPSIPNLPSTTTCLSTASFSMTDSKNFFPLGANLSYDTTNAALSAYVFDNTGYPTSISQAYGIQSFVFPLPQPAGAVSPQYLALRLYTGRFLHVQTYDVSVFPFAAQVGYDGGTFGSQLQCTATKGTFTITRLDSTIAGKFSFTCSGVVPGMTQNVEAPLAGQFSFASDSTSSPTPIPAPGTPSPTPGTPTPTPGGANPNVPPPLMIPIPVVPTQPGTIPAPTALLQLSLPPTYRSAPALIDSSDPVQLNVSTTAAGTPFTNGVTLSAASAPGGLQFAFSPSTIGPGGNGTSTLTVSSGNASPGDYLISVRADGDGASAVSSFRARVFCDPPLILGINQPQSVRIAPGSNGASLTVTSNGSGPFSYQWYVGNTGITDFPLANATGPTAANLTAGRYWVRVTNFCGTADSSAAVVSGP